MYTHVMAFHSLNAHYILMIQTEQSRGKINSRPLHIRLLRIPFPRHIHPLHTPYHLLPVEHIQVMMGHQVLVVVVDE